MGAIINEKQFRRCAATSGKGSSGRTRGSRWARCRPRSVPLSEGFFARPAIVAAASNDWRLAREEIFGPVLVALRWDDIGDAVRMENDSRYGLAAFVWSRDIGQALRTARRVEAG